MKAALANNDGRCDTAFPRLGEVEPGRSDHQQIAAVLLARDVWRAVSLCGVINAKDVRVVGMLLLLLQVRHRRLRVIRAGVLAAQMGLALDAHVLLLHPVAVLTLLPLQNAAQK